MEVYKQSRNAIRLEDTILFEEEIHDEEPLIIYYGPRTTIDFKSYQGKTISKIKSGYYYSLTSKESRTKEQIENFLCITSQLEMTEQQKSNTWNLYTKARNKGLTLGGIEKLILACIYKTTQKSLTELEELTGTPKEKIYKTINKIIKYQLN